MTLSLTNSKMNIQNLPSEILEKILVEGNFLSVSRVCQTWRYHAQRNKSQFDEVFFDLTKDDPKKIEKKNPNQLFIFNSRTIDKNGFRMGPEFETNYREEYAREYSSYLKRKYKKILNEITFANTLNFIYDPLLYINRDDIPKHSKKYILSNNLFASNYAWKIIGIINNFFSNLEDYLYISKNITKNANIVIKDVNDRIENIDPDLFFNLEIDMIHDLLKYRSFECFKKFTFKAPNNTYLIYDENKKLLIIRFGNYEKYNFPMTEISIRRPSNVYHFAYLNNSVNYYINCLMRCDKSICHNSFYPAKLFDYDYENLTKKVEKLIVISFEFHEFMFDRLLVTSNYQKKKIEYHCFDSSKKKSKRKNFKFVPIEKEQEYSFEQMHFKYFEENAF